MVTKLELHEVTYRLVFTHRLHGTDQVEWDPLLEGVLVMLGKVAGRYAGTDPNSTLHRGKVADKNTGQDCLAGTVGPDEADAPPAKEGSVDVAQYLLIPESDGHVAKLQHLLATAVLLSEVERNPAALQDRSLDPLHAVDLALFVPGLLDVALIHDHLRPQFEALHCFLESGDLLLLGTIQNFLPPKGYLPVHSEGRIVPRPDLELAGLQLGNAANGFVQEVAIVRNDHYPAIKSSDEGFHLLPGPEIQVGFGLVEQ